MLALKKSVIFSSPEPKAHNMSLYDGIRAGVRLCVSPRFSNMKISHNLLDCPNEMILTSTHNLFLSQHNAFSCKRDICVSMKKMKKQQHTHNKKQQQKHNNKNMTRKSVTFSNFWAVILYTLALFLWVGNNHLKGSLSVTSPKKNVKIRAYSEPLIREIAEKQMRWVIDNSWRIIFNIFENNIHCWYSFEWPWPDDSNEYVQNMFL